MFYQPLMTEEERALQQEVRKFVRDEVSHDFMRALDRDEILYPREYVENLAAHNLLGLRFDPKWGGIGYTDVYPIEKMVRDIRLCQIWTGTNEIMNLLIQHEYYQEVLKGAGEVRNVELDATHYQDEAEKCFTDDDMWRVHQE